MCNDGLVTLDFWSTRLHSHATIFWMEFDALWISLAHLTISHEHVSEIVVCVYRLNFPRAFLNCSSFFFVQLKTVDLRSYSNMILLCWSIYSRRRVSLSETAWLLPKMTNLCTRSWGMSKAGSMERWVFVVNAFWNGIRYRYLESGTFITFF